MDQGSYWAISGFSSENFPGVKRFASMRLAVQMGDDDSYTFFDISSIVIEHALNDIPTCTVSVPFGRKNGSLETNFVSEKSQRIRRRAYVELSGSMGEFSTKTDDNGKIRWKDGSYRLFEGFVVGGGYGRSQGRLRRIFRLRNFLLDFTLSSVGSVDVVPGGPSDLLQSVVSQGAAAKKYANAGTEFLDGFTTTAPVDMGKAVTDILVAIAKKNKLQVPELAGKSNQPNQAAADLIEKYYKPKRAYPFSVNSTSVASASIFSSEVVASSLAGSDFWNMLISGLLPNFGMAVVPLSDRFLLAPVLPTSHREGATIEGAEYLSFEDVSTSQKPLYGVGVYGRTLTGTNFSLQNDGRTVIGSQFVPVPKDEPDGAWKFVPAPTWLDDIPSTQLGARLPEPIVHQELNTVTPTAATVGLVALRPQDLQLGNVLDEINETGAKYAELVYASTALTGRSAVLMGKLRFDISPGMTVKVKGRQDISESTDSEAGSDYFGFVTRVTVAIDADAPSAMTTLTLTNTRTAAENDLSAGKTPFSMLDHPFFASFFESAELVYDMIEDGKTDERNKD